MVCVTFHLLLLNAHNFEKADILSPVQGRTPKLLKNRNQNLNPFVNQSIENAGVTLVKKASVRN